MSAATLSRRCARLTVDLVVASKLSDTRKVDKGSQCERELYYREREDLQRERDLKAIEASLELSVQMRREERRKKEEREGRNCGGEGDLWSSVGGPSASVA